LIAADTSSLIAFFKGDVGRDVDLVVDALTRKTFVLPPPALTELASSQRWDAVQLGILGNSLMTQRADFWLRAGDSRRLLLGKGLKVSLADTLIAQCCIDADVELITRDTDFRHFAQWCGLKLA
jgi:predicted nucleic acid-binding protein